jgi:predicted nucleic acid-binding protein
MKNLSKNIITNISLGKESIITTVVHLSEIANILKHSLTKKELNEIIHGVFDRVEVLGVTREEYLAASELAQELDFGDPNDALAYQVMSDRDLNEIYSFDQVFERVEGIRRLPAL